MGNEDGNLIERWRQGEPGAFEALVERWQEPVARFLGRLVTPPDQVTDLCQEVFLRVYLHGARFQGNGSFSTWVYRIALNLARDAGRRQRRRRFEPLDDREPAITNNPPDSACEQNELRKVMARALAELPENLREVLVLRHYQGMNFEEMGRLLQVPASTLKSRFAVALERLRRRLQSLGWTHEDTP